MKILHMISGGDVGGAKTHVLSLLQGLLESETVQLVCFTEGPFAQEARELGIPTQVLPGHNLPKVRKALLRLIREGGFEIIHCHGSRANLMGALLRGAAGVPVVTTVHSDYRLDYLGRPLGRLTYGTLNTLSLRKLDYYVGVSDAMAELLIARRFPAQRIFAIYNGVPFPPKTPTLDRAAFLSSLGVKAGPEDPVFGIAARLNPVKDMGTLIRAFAKTVAACPNARLIIAGDGEQGPELRALASELCPEGSVCFAGWVADTDSFYSAIDCNLLTSLSETFPYALTEGAVHHCATIASRVGGIPALISHGVNGLLFPAQDVDALAEALTSLARSSEIRERYAQALYERVRDFFSVQATVEKQKEIYRTILRRQARNAGARDGVMICGAYGKDNAGDDAILETIVAQMQALDPDLPLCVLSRKPISTRQRYRIDAVQTFNFFAFLRRMRRTRLYLSGGGSLIQDATSSRSLLYYLFNIYCAKKTGNQVLMYGCGIGPVSRPANRARAARIISRYVDLVTLREDSSREELQRMGVSGPEIRVTADPALLLQPAQDAQVDSFLLSQGLDPKGAYCLFSLRPWTGFEDHLQDFAACAEAAWQQGLTPLFFHLEPERDAPAAEKVAKLLSCPCAMLPVPPSGALTVGVIARARAVVSMRLHALIFATAQNVPTVGVVYDPKVRSYLDYLGEHHYLDLAQVSAQGLTDLLQAALSSQDRPDPQNLRALALENQQAARELLGL